ncbi:MAG: hypothetical protein D6E12_07780 [Desulfovibrio sp.]|nr:MAG: hypothetical protein D6E12_07780 [Desulfovibrio sp.]
MPQLFKTYPILWSLALVGLLTLWTPAPQGLAQTQVEEIPPWFSSLVPTFAEAQGTRFVDMRPQGVCSYDTPFSREEVIAFYRDGLLARGWEVIREVEQYQQMTMGFSRDEYRVVVDVTKGVGQNTEVTVFLGGPGS